ncbi:MAG: carbohydrate binding domain-containing protein [Verrucomicrobiota bacterium]
MDSSASLLVNGDFSRDTRNWVLEEAGATGWMECVPKGPEDRPALKVTVSTVGDKAWRLQLYQAGVHIEKGRHYVLTFRAKASRPETIMVNCMQDHEPWDHHTQMQVSISTEWKRQQVTFEGPWTDDKSRISFTNLGTTPGQVWWFADCSLVAK